MRFEVYGTAEEALSVHKEGHEVSAALYGLSSDVVYYQPFLNDIAERYNISNNPQDYIFVTVPIVRSDIPNRKLLSFRYEDLNQVNPQLDIPAWKTLLYMPIHYEHNNKDNSKALGFIADVTFLDKGPFNSYIYILIAFDRTKRPDLASTVAEGNAKWSMGAWVDSFVCSACGEEYVIEDGKPVHHHNSRLGQIEDDVLIYRAGTGITFFETSYVSIPAFHKALSKEVIK